MVDTLFWEEVHNAWVTNAPPKISDVKTGSGGEIDPSLLQDIWEPEEIITEVETQSQQFDWESFDALMDKQSIPDYIEACKMLTEGMLPESLKKLYKELIKQLTQLQSVSEKNTDSYQPDLFSLNEIHIPDLLNITTRYIGFLETTGMGEDIIKDTEEEIKDAIDSLIICIKDEITRIDQFTAMDLRASARANASIIRQNGSVDPSMKIK